MMYWTSTQSNKAETCWVQLEGLKACMKSDLHQG